MSGSGFGEVALRPWPTPKKDKLDAFDIFTQVGRLTSERGHLRNITEDALQEELERGKDVAEEADVMEGVEEAEKVEAKDAPTQEDRLKELFIARNKMWQKLEFAHFYASNALDLVSLVLSKDEAKAPTVEPFFSDSFKAQNIPRASFGVAKVVEAPKSASEAQRHAYEVERWRLVSRGSRMQALDGAVDRVLKAATILETEVRKEVHYWDEILSISEKGWSLQRFRKGTRHSPFAVQYGFREASDHFKARGLAPLQMDKDGSIILDPALALQPKTLRVRISDNGEITGTSSLAIRNDATQSAIEKSIQLARDSLFEEELYHEISLETRQLLAYGVELRDSVVHLAVPGPTPESTQRKILIDIIPRDDDTFISPDQTHNWLAQNVAEGLRLLLAHEHSMRRFRRSQPSPGFTLRKKQAKSPPLLRTLLAVLSHISCVDSLHSYLDRVASTLNTAGLSVSVSLSRETSWTSLTSIISASTQKGLSPIDQILEFFVKPFDALATLSLPSSTSSSETPLQISTRTFFSNPTFGTEYKVTIPSSLATLLNLSADQKREFKFTGDQEEVKDYVDWLLSLDIAHNLLLGEYGKRATLRSRDTQVTVNIKEGKKVRQKDVLVECKGGRLMVLVGETPLLGGEGAGEYAWDGRRGDVGIGFREKVKSLLG